MPVHPITYETLVRIFGETMTKRFYTPVSCVRR